MTAITPSSTVYCPQCGTTNDDYLDRCVTCDALLDPAAEAASEAAKAPRPFHAKAFGISAGVAVVLVLVCQLLGWTFTMGVLPASESPTATANRIETLARDGDITRADAQAVAFDLSRQTMLRTALANKELNPSEAQRARDVLRPEDQSLVLGIGGISSLLPPLLAFFAAAIVATVLVRTRRVLEVAAGAAVGAVAQLGAWIVAADFSVGAVMTGDLWMTGSSLGFKGAPIMLLGMALVLYVAWTALVSLGFGIVLESLTGVAACSACEHRFSLRPKAPAACPKCGLARKRHGGPRYREGDLFLAELGPTANGVTLASAGAAELLCLRCARTYAADSCPSHPHEPLLDPTQDEVRFRLLELDAEAGTARYVRWTREGLGVDGPQPVAPSGPLLCMECAKTYDRDTCPTHPDEPLLDPQLEAVRIELIQSDDRARARMSTRLMFASVGVAFAAAFGVGVVLDDAASLSAAAFAGVLAALVTVSSIVAPKLAPPRFTAWTGEGNVDLDEFGMGAEASIFAPLRRAARRARDNFLRAALAGLAGGVVGAGIAFGLDWSILALGMVGLFIGLIAYAMIDAIVADTKTVVGAVRDAKAAWDDPYA